MIKVILFSIFFLFMGTSYACAKEPKDEGFLKIDGNNLDVRWDPDDLPILIFVHPSAAMWLFHAEKAAAVWNKRLGFPAFKVSMDIHREAMAFLNNSPGIVPIIGFSLNEHCPNIVDVMTCNPHTLQRANRINGLINMSGIWMPIDLATAVRPDAYLLVVHEMGHVLGLTHDETLPNYYSWSIMEPAIDLSTIGLNPPPITDADLARLRNWYVYRKGLDECRNLAKTSTIP